jgi:hypothetical protein
MGSLHKKLDELLTKVGELVDGIEGVKSRLDKIERRFYDHILEEKEQKLLGPDVYPATIEISRPYMPPPMKPIPPESPSVVMYGVTMGNDTTFSDYETSSELYVSED